MTAALLLALCGSLHAEFVDLFEPHEFTYTGGGYHKQVFPYRLFVPDHPGPLPLLVWLHGKGEAGDDNVQHLGWLDTLIFRPPWNRTHYPFFVLVLQCPNDNPVWIRTTGPDDMVNVVAASINDILQRYPIDPDRVVLSGVSSGGVGCWHLATRYPGLFAGVAPMAGEAPQQVENLTGVPLWAFHSERDEWISPSTVRRAVRLLRESGGRVALTEIPTHSHDCWTAAFEDYHVLDWLLAQRRGKSGPEPGKVSIGGQLHNLLRHWTVWQLTTQGMIAVAVLSLIWLGWKRMRPKNAFVSSASITPVTRES